MVEAARAPYTSPPPAASFAGLVLGVMLLGGGSVAAGTGELPARLPVECSLGETCFIQQLPDTEPGSGSADPFCGSATYDGHDGIDVRVRSLSDMARGVYVVAVAPGKVLRTRDAMADALARTPRRREAVKGRECGNGLVLDLGGGLVAQYCHLKRGSLAVLPGETVRAGERLGLVGASGLAAFPHVHLSFRRNGEKIDPATGRPLAGGCRSGAEPAGLLAGEADLVRRDFAEALLVGISDRPIDYDRLVEEGPPPAPVAGRGISVAYGWFMNLKRGDRISLVLKGPGGATVSDATSLPLSSDKAVYAYSAGKRRPLTAGRWSLVAVVLRDGHAILTRQREVTVAPADAQPTSKPSESR